MAEKVKWIWQCINYYLNFQDQFAAQRDVLGSNVWPVGLFLAYYRTPVNRPVGLGDDAAERDTPSINVKETI